MAHPDRSVMRAARVRFALLLGAMLVPSTSSLAQGGDKDADTRVVAKGFKVEVNGEFLPVRSFSGVIP